MSSELGKSQKIWKMILTHRRQHFFLTLARLHQIASLQFRMSGILLARHRQEVQHNQHSRVHCHQVFVTAGVRLAARVTDGIATVQQLSPSALRLVTHHQTQHIPPDMCMHRLSALCQLVPTPGRAHCLGLSLLELAHHARLPRQRRHRSRAFLQFRRRHLQFRWHAVL